MTDTPSYEHVPHLALWDWRFYTGERGFTIPLFFKTFQTSESPIVAQLVFSVIAWTVLAAVVARCVETDWLRPVVFAVVLAFSLTTEVTLWDAAAQRVGDFLPVRTPHGSLTRGVSH